MNKHKSILVIAAHPDDETLGVGGTIHNSTSSGITVDILLLSSTHDFEIGVKNECQTIIF